MIAIVHLVNSSNDIEQTTFQSQMRRLAHCLCYNFFFVHGVTSPKLISNIPPVIMRILPITLLFTKQNKRV